MGVIGLGVGSLGSLGYAAEPVRQPLESAGITVGELIGWRIWRLSRGFLTSYSADYAWLPGHPAQGEITDHGYGGIWAFKDPHRAFRKALENDGLYVTGSVWLWGEVIEHDIGYRGEYGHSDLDAIRSLIRWAFP
jgi:hypothetical protein